MENQALEESKKENIELRKRVLVMAWPVFIEMLLEMTVGIVDIIMVGKLGPSAIAAVGFANSLLWLVIAVFAAISVGTTALVARHIGAGEIGRAHVIARQSLVLSVALGAMMTLLGVMFAEEGIRLMMFMQSDPDPEVVRQGTLFLTAVSLTMIPGLILQIANAVLRGAGDTKTPMRVTLVVNLVNIAGNLVLINGLPAMEILGWSFPGFAGLGVLGAGISSAFSRALGGVLVLVVLFKGNRIITLSLKDSYRLNWVEMKRILNIGVPAAVEQLILRGGQMVYGIIVGGLGTVAYAAHQVALTAESLSFLPGFSFAVVATTLVGQFLGAGNARMAEKSARLATKLAMVLMSIMGLIFFFFAPEIVRLFSNDSQVVDLGAQVLRIVAISQPSLALVMVLAGALRGAGDTRTVLYVTAAGIWVLRVALAYLFVNVWGWGLVGAWYAMIIDLFVRGLLLLWRFRQGKWKSIRV